MLLLVLLGGAEGSSALSVAWTYVSFRSLIATVYDRIGLCDSTRDLEQKDIPVKLAGDRFSSKAYCIWQPELGSNSCK